jgi:hypothetical protein
VSEKLGCGILMLCARDLGGKTGTARLGRRHFSTVSGEISIELLGHRCTIVVWLFSLIVQYIVYNLRW